MLNEWNRWWYSVWDIFMQWHWLVVQQVIWVNFILGLVWPVIVIYLQFEHIFFLVQNYWKIPFRLNQHIVIFLWKDIIWDINVFENRHFLALVQLASVNKELFIFGLDLIDFRLREISFINFLLLVRSRHRWREVHIYHRWNFRLIYRVFYQNSC